jgi:hypothetical protein
VRVKLQRVTRRYSTPLLFVMAHRANFREVARQVALMTGRTRRAVAFPVIQVGDSLHRSIGSISESSLNNDGHLESTSWGTAPMAVWSNTLTGWTSGGVSSGQKYQHIVSTTTMNSRARTTKFGAIEIIHTDHRPNGRSHSVILPGTRTQRPKGYADNFSVSRRGSPIWP